eukprot:5739984-Lingulodinium_polyedra.AAC.1
MGGRPQGRGPPPRGQRWARFAAGGPAARAPAAGLPRFAARRGRIGLPRCGRAAKRARWAAL